MNRNQRGRIATLGAVLFLLAGCQQLMNQEAAVQQAIRDHLASRSDLALDKMTMEVQQVTVNGETAQAEVVFRVTGEVQSQMAYQYELRREGGRWRVDRGRPVRSETPHPSMGEVMGESGAGPSSSDAAGGASPLNLPEGHPPIPEANPPGNAP
ncbi:MAG TPA: hypothetical protein VNN17_13110 [Terriglobia bacterium]|nr:hypothetical protein [Terriglobia bacterium]